MPVDRKVLLEELNTIEENCLYTAQAHFEISRRTSGKLKVLFVTASVVSGAAGALVAAGAPLALGVVGAVAGAVGAVASAMGATENVQAHSRAGQVLTRMRHEARALREAFAAGMSDDELSAAVKAASDRYNDLVHVLPQTDPEAMEVATKLVKAGTFEPDFRQPKPVAALVAPQNPPPKS